MKWKLMSNSLAVLIMLTVTAVFAQTAEDVQKHQSCKYCGMDRQKFAHSRMRVVYDDGSEFGACSIHCVAINLAQTFDKTPTAIQVGDYNTKQLIDAEKSTWVIGGKKPGVMTRNAKWAFAKPTDAQVFIQENDGKTTTFEEAMKSAYEDMYNDSKMIREKRAKMKMLQQGQKQ